MKCEYCDNEVPIGSARCPSCGAAVIMQPHQVNPCQDAGGEQRQGRICEPSVTQAHSQDEYSDPYLYIRRKSRGVYIALAFFLGVLGVHNFYAGYAGRGVAQLLITLMSFGLLSWISLIWAIIEMCAISEDGRGIPFQ